MNNSLKFSSFISFIAVVIVLLTSVSTENASAQFGLFDTVWTTNNFKISGSGHSTISNNDSLLFLFKPGKYAVLDDTSEKYILFRSLDLQDTVWYISNYPTQNEPLSFIENDSKILFDSRTWTVPRTDYVNSSIITRDADTFQVVDSVAFDYWTFPPNTGSCYKWFAGVSEVDTSVYYWGYCGATAIRGISYKVNYRTGQVKETSHILPYFAMTISEDGQYVAGVYYTGGGGTNVPYNEVIEVRKISDYSVVFRKESKYCDYTPNFAPSQWVTKYKFKFSKDNKFLALNYGYFGITVYNLENHQKIFSMNASMGECTFSKNNKILFFKDINKSERLVCLYDCFKQSYKELEYNSTKRPAGDAPEIIFEDQYILTRSSNYYDVNLSNFKKLGDITLFKLNFEINSVQNPDNPIEGTLYPNPTNMNLTLKLQLESPKTLSTSLFNTVGYLIKEFGINQCEEVENILYFNVSELSPGTYFLRITGDNFSQTYKVIINR